MKKEAEINRPINYVRLGPKITLPITKSGESPKG